MNVGQMWRLTHHPHFTSTIAYVTKRGVTYCMSLGELSVGDGHWIDDISSTGATITLDDGSVWLISPLDQAASSIWLPIDNVVVRHSRDPSYPYLIVNTDEGETASARFVASR